jgi:hypothetical protein
MEHWIAKYESRSFTFEGVGCTPRAAADNLFKGLRAHQREYGCVRNWWLDGDKDNAAFLENQCSLRLIEAGCAYRDEQPKSLIERRSR